VQEQENLRAALNWWLEGAEQPDGQEAAGRALRLCNTLYPFWRSRINLREARDFFERALGARTGVTEAVVAKALGLTSQLLYFLSGDMEQMEALAQESLALARQAGAKEELALALQSLSIAASQLAPSIAFMEEAVALYQQAGKKWERGVCLSDLALSIFRQGNYKRGLALHEECLALFEALGDQRRVGLSLIHLASDLCLSQGDLDRAATLAEQGRARFQETGEVFFNATACYKLAEIRRLQGNLADAHTLLEEAQSILEEQWSREAITEVQLALARLLVQEGDLTGAQALFRELRVTDFRAQDAADFLEGWGAVEVRLGAPEGAARMLGAAEALRELLGIPRFPVYQAEHTQAVEATRAGLGQAAFAAAWAEGRGMTPAQVLAAMDAQPATALPPTQATRHPTLPEGLTPREMEVLRLLADARSNPQIAGQLVIATHTVHAHVRSIYNKLGVTNRTEATRYALEHHLL
jgi:ATP/maltotriose-dependent transcriptional regulator MalT